MEASLYGQKLRAVWRCGTAVVQSEINHTDQAVCVHAERLDRISVVTLSIFREMILVCPDHCNTVKAADSNLSKQLQQIWGSSHGELSSSHGKKLTDGRCGFLSVSGWSSFSGLVPRKCCWDRRKQQRIVFTLRSVKNIHEIKKSNKPKSQWVPPTGLYIYIWIYPEPKRHYSISHS